MYNTSAICSRANRNAAKYDLTQSEAMRRSWVSEKAAPVNAERIAAAKAEAGVTEEVNTWAGWKKLGFEVIHGSKALFSVTIIYGTKDTTYKASFFSRSQVAPC